MDNKDLAVFVLSAVIGASGIYLNATRKGQTGKDPTLHGFRVWILSGLLGALIVWGIGVGKVAIPAGIFTLGGLLVISGLVLRWAAVLSLKGSFTVQVQIREGQQLLTQGVFRLIRHPSYTGLLLYYTGLGLTMQNGISLAMLLFFPLIAVLPRIRHEEQVLLEAFGADYTAYQAQSWRLVPGLY